MDLLGVSFQEIGGADLNVQDVLPGTGIDVWGGDLLRVWGPVTAKYVSAYYFEETYSSDYKEEYGPGWATPGQVRLDFPIAAGQGFWLTTADATSVTIAGEVLQATDNKVSTLATKMDILCNTFPVDINVQDVKPVSGIDTWGGDLLRIWNPVTATYVSAYYFEETYSADYQEEYGAGWATPGQVRLDIPIASGQGFWLTTGTDAVVEFFAPAGIL